MKKLLAVGVIILFLGVAFAPSINANISKASIDSELVEITTEVCGINGVTPNTVLLSKEDAEEIEQLFDSIRERLNATETREEAEQIFNEAVVELDKYGLLGGLSVRQAQRMVTRRNQPFRDLQLEIDDTEYMNLGCLMAGRVDVMNIRHLLRLRMNFYGYILNLFPGNPFFSPIRTYCQTRISILWMRAAINPIQILNTQIFGKSGGEDWLFTLGLLGIKLWRGHFDGNISFPMEWPSGVGGGTFYPATLGFTGISISILFIEVGDFIPALRPFVLGTAPIVSVKLLN